MRIALIAPPYLTVPPRGYGGIEQVVALLADGLSRRGHDVTLFASGGSRTEAELASPLARAPGEAALGDVFPALSHALDAYLDPRPFDVVHDHTAEGTALAVASGRAPVVHTLHGPWTDSARAYYRRIHERVALVAISETQRADNTEVRYAGVVPNGIDVDAHPFRAEKDDYLVFVGRSTPDKGPEHAVEVARRAEMRLVMVVKRAEQSERRHWDNHVAPRLQGDEIILEDIAHDDLAGLISGARAMIFPIQWPEPFGLVIAEAMACGTPVVTRPLGAATEIVVDGETGFLREDLDGMVTAVRRAGTISPEACRRRIVDAYSADTMVDGYERLYSALGEDAGKGDAGTSDGGGAPIAIGQVSTGIGPPSGRPPAG